MQAFHPFQSIPLVLDRTQFVLFLIHSLFCMIMEWTCDYGTLTRLKEGPSIPGVGRQVSASRSGGGKTSLAPDPSTRRHALLWSQREEGGGRRASPPALPLLYGPTSPPTRTTRPWSLRHPTLRPRSGSRRVSIWVYMSAVGYEGILMASFHGFGGILEMGYGMIMMGCGVTH